MIGTVVVDEVIAPIERLYLAEGKIWVSVTLPGRTFSSGTTEVRFHGPDGSLVFVEEMEIPKVAGVPQVFDSVTYEFSFWAQAERWMERIG